MDFIDELRQFSSRVEKIKDVITTEEATKNSLILPFFQLLGYDVFNPLEFVPEYTADVGTKKGEKVDYAIVVNDEPAILIEAKWCGEPLDKHDSQLFRYFVTTTAKFGILTNGVTYKFYTDLNEPNKMDLDPFLVFNVLDIQENIVAEVKRFAKATLDIDAAFNAASELKFTNLIKTFVHSQRTNPNDDFVKYMMSQIYDGTRTQQAIERFRPIVKRGLNQYINDAINETLKNAIKSHDPSEPALDAADAQAPSNAIPVDEQVQDRIITTQEELEAFGIIKGLLHGEVDPSKLSYKDTENYFAVLYDNKTTKWICRLKLDRRKKIVVIPPAVEPPLDKETKHNIASINDLYEMRDLFITSIKRFTE